MKNFKPILASLLFITATTIVPMDSTLAEWNAAKDKVLRQDVARARKIAKIQLAEAGRKTSGFVKPDTSFFSLEKLNKRIMDEKATVTDQGLMRKAIAILALPEGLDIKKAKLKKLSKSAYYLDTQEYIARLFKSETKKLDNFRLPPALLTSEDTIYVASIIPSPARVASETRAASASPLRPSPVPLYPSPDRVTAVSRNSNPSPATFLVPFDVETQAFCGAGNPDESYSGIFGKKL